MAFQTLVPMVATLLKMHIPRPNESKAPGMDPKSCILMTHPYMLEFDSQCLGCIYMKHSPSKQPQDIQHVLPKSHQPWRGHCRRVTLDSLFIASKNKWPGKQGGIPKMAILVHDQDSHDLVSTKRCHSSQSLHVGFRPLAWHDSAWKRRASTYRHLWPDLFLEIFEILYT